MRVRKEEAGRSSLQSDLEEDLRRLQRLVPLEESLQVCLKPTCKTEVLGEVRGSTIFIYSNNPSEASQTLKHEYIDYLLSRKLIDPLVSMINALTKIREDEIYRSKERIVDLLSGLLDGSEEAV